MVMAVMIAVVIVIVIVAVMTAATAYVNRELRGRMSKQTNKFYVFQHFSS